MSLATGGEPREPLPDDRVADDRLVATVRRSLPSEDGEAPTAIRMICTGDHLDAARLAGEGDRRAGPSRNGAVTQQTVMFQTVLCPSSS